MIRRNRELILNFNSDGMTPLHIACAKGLTELIEILLSNGANPAIKTSQGSSFDVAERTNHKEVICRIFEHYNLTQASNSSKYNIQEIDTVVSEFVAKYNIPIKSLSPDPKAEEKRPRSKTSLKEVPPTQRARSASLITENDPSSQFLMTKSLGEGAYGQVFRAKHKESGFVVALKNLDLTDEQKESIKSETAILQKCTHPNIVQYYGSFMKQGKVSFILEYCSIGCVLDLLKHAKRPFTEPEVCIKLRDYTANFHFRFFVFFIKLFKDWHTCTVSILFTGI